MKQTDVTVTFYLKKSEMNDEGHCPVMAKLVVGKFSEAAFSAKMSVPAALWASGRATGKSNAAREINRQLDDLRASAISIYDELSATRENVTAEEIRNLLLGTAFGQETLLGYFRTFIEHFEKRVGVNREKGTAQSYRYACNCVAAFIQEKYKLSDVPFTALNRSFIDNYDLYLRTERRFALETIVLLV
ncbi:site-specific integrase, partial [Bacteroides ovatus]